MGLQARREGQEEQDGGQGRSAGGFHGFFHGSVDIGQGADGGFVLLPHGIGSVAARRVTGIFTGIELGEEAVHGLGAGTAIEQRRAHSIAAQLRHVEQQFVGGIAEHGPVELLVEGRMEILLEVDAGGLEPG